MIKRVTIFIIILVYLLYPQLVSAQNISKYQIDTTRSGILWTCGHKGTLSIEYGNIVIEYSELADANFTIDMNSITNTDIDYELMNGTLVNVLKSPELFNTKAFPKAYFELHNTRFISDSTYHFTGDFIIFDNGICTEFDGKIYYSSDSLYIDIAKIRIDRTDWGMYYLSPKNLNPKDGEDGFIVPDIISLELKIRAYLIP